MEIHHTESSPSEVKIALAEMLKGGIIFNVNNPEQARIAEDAGAVAVVAREGFHNHEDQCIKRMTNPELIQRIQEVVSIPVMAPCRQGHFVEAQILEAMFVDFIIEDETLTSSDKEFYILKKDFKIPFVSGCYSLQDALCRISEGAAMLSVNDGSSFLEISSIIESLRGIKRDIKILKSLDASELMSEACHLGAPYPFVELVAKTGKLPVPLFATGKMVTPSDVALMMQLGAESVFVGADIFSEEDPAKLAAALVSAATNYQKPEVLAQISVDFVCK